MKFMKKKLVVVIMITLTIMLMMSIMYAIDRYMMENNKPVVFSTWGYDYAPPVENADKTQELYIDVNQDNESHYFVGTVLEETTTYMIVEPNEDEQERKSSDKIRIDYGTDHRDYLYGIGRKVIIKYNGIILETYPAQIKTDEIIINGYEDFKISVNKSENMKTRKILNNKELYKNNLDYNLYYYGLDEVNVTVDTKTMSLEDALRSGKLTIDGIIAKANQDLDNGTITGDMYKDGGSMRYEYKDYTIIKYHKIDGNRDVYIGIPEMKIK